MKLSKIVLVVGLAASTSVAQAYWSGPGWGNGGGWGNGNGWGNGFGDMMSDMLGGGDGGFDFSMSGGGRSHGDGSGRRWGSGRGYGAPSYYGGYSRYGSPGGGYGGLGCFPHPF